MFFEVLIMLIGALSVAVSLLALWQFLVAGWALNGWFDPRAILVLYLRDNSGDKKWHQALRTKASGAYLRCRRFWKYSVGSGRLKSDPRNDGHRSGV
ncbi:Uncharacterised protein [Klebsiella oxytoca]|nr:Uncharacterised protein [Klebsiella oxytoca]